MKAAPVRLGHSLGNKRLLVDEDALRHVISMVTGGMILEPRDPADPSTVERAERVLNARPRPIYGYVGDLHPDLGSVGIILSPRWAERAIQGASKCDSGGLAGGKGCFVHVPESERDAALQSVSSPGAFEVADWGTHFGDEVDQSYTRGLQGYVSGDEPDTSTWDDTRRHCIAAARSRGDALDRRLWTWEIRLQAPPQIDEFEAIAVSYDARNRLEVLFTEEGVQPPAHL
jgi:hypothetical protein